MISSYIAEAIGQEWPMMARRTITLRIAPHSLAEALQLTLALEPTGHARRQRITDQPIPSQLGQVVIPVLAGSLRIAGDRHGPQRQSARLCDHNGALRDWGSGIRVIDRRLRPTVHRRDIGQAHPAVAGHAD